MKEENNIEEDGFWDESSFVHTMSGDEADKKMKTFHKKHDEDMNFDCRKCGRKISAHNSDWHNGMCDECFDKEYFGRGQ